MRYRHPSHSRWSFAGAAAVTAAAFVALSACSDANEGGYGLPTLTAAARHSVLVASGADVADLTGTMVVEPNGCFTYRGNDPQNDEASRAWIVWPESATQDADIVLLPSGRHLGQGSSLDVSGAFVRLSDLPGGDDETSYLGSFGRYCGADERGVLLLVDVRG